MTNQKPKVKLPQQEAYIAKGKKRAELEAYVNSIVKKAEKEWIALNPEHKDLGVMPLNRTYIRNKKGTTQAIYKIAEQMMWISNMSKTQVEILGDVQKLFPELLLKPTIWNKPLSGATRKKVEEMVKGNMLKPITFTKCNTLAQYRKKVLMQEAVNEGVKTFKTSITFSATSVVFGQKVYPLEFDEVGGNTYPRIRVMHRGKRQALRMDVLVSILKEAEGG